MVVAERGIRSRAARRDALTPARAALAWLVVAGGLLVSGCALTPPRYEFVSTSPPASAPRVAGGAADVAGALDLASLKADVDRLASAEMEGRARGTAGIARARDYIVRRLKASGLAPLFGASYEQSTSPDAGGDAYALNVGAIYPAAAADADWVVLVAHYDHRGMIYGRVQAGADDNASSVALLLAVGDALGRRRPALRRHVVLLFPDAEEPPNVRTEWMGSSWFWRHPPLPTHRLHLALVMDLMAGRASPELRAAGLGEALFVLGAEADPTLATLVYEVTPAEKVEIVRLSLPMIEAMPYLPASRFSRSDYHGLREHGQRPFLLITSGRTETYHTASDTPATLDYEALGHRARWVALLAVHAADRDGDLGWHDWRADARGDAAALLRLLQALEGHPRVGSLLGSALARDRRLVECLLAEWERGEPPTPATYRALLLASLRAQAALWHPSGWWFALW